jgi:hypothetical protein
MKFHFYVSNVFCDMEYADDGFGNLVRLPYSGGAYERAIAFKYGEVSTFQGQIQNV